VSDNPKSGGARRRLEGLDPAALMAEGLEPAGSPAGPDGFTEVPGYDLLDRLGEGGMGVVFLARQRSLDRAVAVKLVRRELLSEEWFPERLEREARLLARLRHPHLVTVHDFLRLPDGTAAVVMEWVEGGNLRDRLRAAPGEIPVETALAWVDQAGSGLAAAHAQGVVHRDVKPENLLLDADGRVRVSDFGMALSLATGPQRLTRSGVTPGTPGYLAPEQIAGGAVDCRTDLYALGVVLYEILTGSLPLGRFEPPRRIRPDVPEEMEQALLRSLDPDPDRRPSSVAEFLAGLRSRIPEPRPETRVVAAGNGKENPAQLPEVDRPRSRRRLLLAGVGLAAVAVTAVRWFRPPGRGPAGRVRAGDPALRPLPLPPDPARVAFAGSWRREGDSLVSGPEVCVLPLMSELPAAWNLRLSVTRLGGVDSVAVFFRHPAGLGTAELDGWSSHRSGVQSLDGDTTRSPSGFTFALEPGREHQLLLAVRPDQVLLSVDDADERVYPLAGRALSVVAPWEWTEDRTNRTALALGSYRSPMRFSRVHWTAVG